MQCQLPEQQSNYKQATDRDRHLHLINHKFLIFGLLSIIIKTLQHWLQLLNTRSICPQSRAIICSLRKSALSKLFVLNFYLDIKSVYITLQISLNIPNPIASELFMILSLLQESVNILQQQTKEPLAKDGLALFCQARGEWELLIFQ